MLQYIFIHLIEQLLSGYRDFALPHFYFLNQPLCKTGLVTDKYREQSPDWVKVGLSLFVRYRSSLHHQPECPSLLLSIVTAFPNPPHRRCFGVIFGQSVYAWRGHSMDTIVQWFYMNKYIEQHFFAAVFNSHQLQVDTILDKIRGSWISVLQRGPHDIGTKSQSWVTRVLGGGARCPHYTCMLVDVDAKVILSFRSILTKGHRRFNPAQTPPAQVLPRSLGQWRFLRVSHAPLHHEHRPPRRGNKYSFVIKAPPSQSVQLRVWRTLKLLVTSLDSTFR